MKRYPQIALLSMLSVVFFALTQDAFAQGVPQADPPQTGVVMTKLSPPVYPPLALAARITGEVKVDLKVRQDGSVASAALFSGHPMLAAAAIESAKQSQFECRACDAVSSYTLTYTFRNTGNGCQNRPPDCVGIENRTPVIQQSIDHVVITADPLCMCDPAGTITRIKWRSSKCLYLWRCSSRMVDSP